MRMILTCLLASLTLSAFSQNINLSLDSIRTLLCKKWQVDYALMGNMKIEQLPGAAEINYEFLKNGTVIMTTNPATGKDKTKGTWSYDVKNKNIKIATYNKNTGEITDLNDGMFVMRMNLDKNGPFAEEMKLVCKPKTTEAMPQEQIQTKSPNVKIKNTSFKNPDSAVLYVGGQNIIEIEGAGNNVFISVTPVTTIKRISVNKFAITPSRKGSVLVTVSQNNKVITTKEFTAVSR